MGTVSTSKKSNAGKNVLVFFIVFIILEMLIIFGLGKVFKNKDVTPSIAGYSIYLTDKELVKTDESGQTVTAVPKNVLVIASNGMPAEDKKNMAVLCEKVEGIGTGVFWLADVQANAAGLDGVIYTISDGKKFYYVNASSVVGVTSTYYETAGKVINFVTNKFGMIACAVVPLFLLVLIEIIIAIATSSKDEDEEDDEEEEEEESDVQLDDFLFGGTSEGEQIARRRRQLEQQESGEQEDNDAESVSASAPLSESEEENEEKFAESVAADNVEEISADSTAVDESYYEKASKLLDEASEEAEEVSKPEPQRKPAAAPRAVRPVRPKTSAGNANASLEDLMKLMEEEQNKLRNSLKK